MPRLAQRASILATFVIAGPPLGFILIWPASAILTGHNPIPTLAMSGFLILPFDIIGAYLFGGIPAILAGIIVSTFVNPAMSRLNIVLSAMVGSAASAIFVSVIGMIPAHHYRGRAVRIHSPHAIDNLVFFTLIGGAVAACCFLIGSELSKVRAGD